MNGNLRLGLWVYYLSLLIGYYSPKACLSTARMEVGVWVWYSVEKPEVLLKECKKKAGIHPLIFKIDYVRSQFSYKPGDYPEVYFLSFFNLL